MPGLSSMFQMPLIMISHRNRCCFMTRSEVLLPLLLCRSFSICLLLICSTILRFCNSVCNMCNPLLSQMIYHLVIRKFLLDCKLK